MDTLTFKDYLVVEGTLTEALKKKKKIPKPKPRPKKNLWFGDKNNWHDDLTFVHGHGGFELHHSVDEENEEDRDFYATHPGGKIVWGVWKGKQKRGITYHKPRHISVVKNPRQQIKQLDTAGEGNTNITSNPAL